MILFAPCDRLRNEPLELGANFASLICSFVDLRYVVDLTVIRNSVRALRDFRCHTSFWGAEVATAE